MDECKINIIGGYIPRFFPERDNVVCIGTMSPAEIRDIWTFQAGHRAPELFLRGRVLWDFDTSFAARSQRKSGGVFRVVGKGD